VKWKSAVDSVLVGGQPVCRINTDTNPANDDSACVPVNIFGIGSIAPGQVPYVAGTTRLIQKQAQHDIALNIDGILFKNWAGDVSVAFGGEYRKDSLTGSTDATSLLKQWRVLNPQPTDGDLSVREGYAEVVFPLLAEQPFFKKLEINAAGRVTDYSRSGEVETWKAGVNWTISSDIRLRATRSRDIRAPNLNELFQARGANVGSFNDPRTNSNVSIFWSSGGNPHLKPEKADTLTVGGVLSPSFVPGLQMSVDYYHIKINDVISSFGAQQVLDGCYIRGQTDFCSGVHLDPVTNAISSVDAVRFNANKLSTAGLDFEISYRMPVDRVFQGMNGNLSLRLLANYIDKLITTASGVPTDSAGDSRSTPHWRANLNATYSNGPFRATVLVRWIQSGLYNTTYVEGVDINNNHVPGRTYVNVSAEHKIGDHFTVFGKVDNLFNVYPPLTPNTVLGPQTATSPLFDTIGRKFAIGARFEF
jgi:outer membrane receptor protein involved in Fe transport